MEEPEPPAGTPLSEQQLNKKRVLGILKTIPGALKNLSEASKVFQPIRKSIYLDRKQKVPSEDDIFVCECIKSTTARPEQLVDPKLSIDCGDKCINRMVCTECELSSCPCGELCQNRKFQTQMDKAVYPFRTNFKGWGLMAGEAIPKGSFVLQYIGEIFSVKSSEGIKRMAECAQSTCTYLMKLSSKELIDPTHKGNIARFINHSCEPNCITQKWNVLGEVVVGIFAIKDIQLGEELTFDYKFDVYKTPLMVCYCGTPNCRGYLGLRPLNYTNEEWENKMNNLPCEICKSNYENDDDHLLICDNCNNGFHMECLTPALSSVPKGAWFCPECTAAQNQQSETKTTPDQLPLPKASDSSIVIESHGVVDDSRSRRKQQFYEVKMKIFKEFDSLCTARKFFEKIESPEVKERIKQNSETVLKTYILTPLELSLFKERGSKLIFGFPNVRVFWVNNDSYFRQYFVKQIEVSISCPASQGDIIDELLNLIEEAAKNYKESIGSVEKSFRIPAIFLKRLLGEYYMNLKAIEREFNVKVHFNKKHVTDDCFPIHYLTTIILKSRSENIANAYANIKQKISELVARRKYMSRGDIKIIINKLSYIKKEISPTEIRCNRDNALRDISNPFYTIYYKDKEVALIGTLEEVMRAERKVHEIIEANRKIDEVSLSLNFLIPAGDKQVIINIKNKSEKNFPGNKMIVYDPLHPRKNSSVTLTSTYKEFDEYLDYFKRQLDKKEFIGFVFNNYQEQSLFQICKHFYKSIHNYRQTKSLVFVKQWDVVTEEFGPNCMSFLSLFKQMQHRSLSDQEFLFYLVRVNELFSQEALRKIGIGVDSVVDVVKGLLVRKLETGNFEYSIFGNLKSSKKGHIPELVEPPPSLGKQQGEPLVESRRASGFREQPQRALPPVHDRSYADTRDTYRPPAKYAERAKSEYYNEYTRESERERDRFRGYKPSGSKEPGVMKPEPFDSRYEDYEMERGQIESALRPEDSREIQSRMRKQEMEYSQRNMPENRELRDSLYDRPGAMRRYNDPPRPPNQWLRNEQNSQSSERSFYNREARDPYRRESRFQSIREGPLDYSDAAVPRRKEFRDDRYKEEYDFDKPDYKKERRDYREPIDYPQSLNRERDLYDRRYQKMREDPRDMRQPDFRPRAARETEEEYLLNEQRYARPREPQGGYPHREYESYSREQERQKYVKDQSRAYDQPAVYPADNRPRGDHIRPRDPYESRSYPQRSSPYLNPDSQQFLSHPKPRFDRAHDLPHEYCRYDEYPADEEATLRRKDTLGERKEDPYKRPKG